MTVFWTGVFLAAVNGGLFCDLVLMHRRLAARARPPAGDRARTAERWAANVAGAASGRWYRPPGAYEHYRERFVETGQQWYLDRMMAALDEARDGGAAP